MPVIRFAQFESFAIEAKNKESPREMPYLTFSLALPNEESRNIVNNLIKEDLNRLFGESQVDKTLLETKPERQFLKTTWQRDSYLYFNGIYFPWRWVNTKGQVRPEREAFVLSTQGMNENINLENIYKRVLKDGQEEVLAMGEGGLYFPDHDNKTLFISSAIAPKEKSSELDNKIIEMHKKVFGNDIEVCILPSPDTTPHIDTHFSIIPKTKKALIENGYYEKLKQSNKLEELANLGYESIQIPTTSINCPLNILYLENSTNEIVAFLHPDTPNFVIEKLKSNNIKSFKISDYLAEVVDNNEGGMRCMTNELDSKDSKFLSKIGFVEK